jgi:putative DNA primase/helicase
MPISIDRAKAILDEFVEEYPSALELHFYFVEGTLGEAYGIEDPSHEAHTAKAAYRARTPNSSERGEIHGSLANAVDDADFRRSLRHEVIGHHGINTLTPGQKRAVLDGLIQGRADADLSEVWARIVKQYPSVTLDMQAE